MTEVGSGGTGGEARKIGKYVVKRELGRGGMGAVYLAEQPGLGREVAIKELIISAAADPTALARFTQEARVMARSSHPNLVQVHDLEQEGQANYIVLEYVKGRSLRDWLVAGRVPLPKVFAVMHGLLQALDYAHKHAIVHRDVKPENLLLSDEGDVKVTDFGIARLTDDPGIGTATKTGTTVGTPQYMSPEQVASSKVDGRSDLYSAGIILYELVCGRPPFVASETDGPFTLMAKHVQAPPPPPTLLSPGLDPELEQVVLKSLAKRPEDRYQTGAEFDAALTGVADRLAPGWQRSLDPEADLAQMTPAAMPVAATMAGLGSLPAAGGAAASPSTAPPAPLVPTAARTPTVAPAPSPTLPPLYAPPPPLPPARRTRKGPSPVLLGGGALALAVVIGVILVSTMSGQMAPSPSPIPATSVAPAGNCDWLKPGVELGAGKGSGSCAVLGAGVLSVPFAGAGSLPSDLKVEATDSNGNPATQPPAVAVAGGYARVAAPTRGYEVRLVTASVTSTNSIVVADFTPTGNGDADIGLGARCAQGQCVRISVSPKTQKYRFDELTPGIKVPTSLLTGDALVQVGQPNRLVLSISGPTVRAWLNGQLLAQVSTSVAAQPGPLRFFNTDQDAGGPSVVNLAGFYVYNPG